MTDPSRPPACHRAGRRRDTRGCVVARSVVAPLVPAAGALRQGSVEAKHASPKFQSGSTPTIPFCDETAEAGFILPPIKNDCDININ